MNPTTLFLASGRPIEAFELYWKSRGCFEVTSKGDENARSTRTNRLAFARKADDHRTRIEKILLFVALEEQLLYPCFV